MPATEFEDSDTSTYCSIKLSYLQQVQMLLAKNLWSMICKQQTFCVTYQLSSQRTNCSHIKMYAVTPH